MSDIHRPPEYDAEIEIAGEVIFFRRSLGLVRRLEQRFGALPALFRALDTASVTQAQMASIYEEFARGADGAPRLAEIAAWIFETGHYACAKALARVIGEMTVGAKALRDLEDRRMAEAEERGQNPTRPASVAPAQILN